MTRDNNELLSKHLLEQSNHLKITSRLRPPATQ